jgi:type VI secretion system protein ImpF
MSPVDRQTRVNLSVLDRLIDLDPDSSEEVGPTRLRSLHELENALWRDLSILLNTRRRERPISPEFEQCNTSLLVFGLPDFTTLSLRSAGDQRKLGVAIETAIRTFEPRLSSVSVYPEPRSELDPVLKYRVEALLDIEPAPEPIAFDTVLQDDTGRFLVTGQNQ